MKFIIILLGLQLFKGCHNNFSKNTQPDYRPIYHFSPAFNWTNDPNGLVYYRGRYHLFYQYNPFGTRWGHMSWGHATSSDLLNWKQEPVAIPEYSNPDSTITGVFSGTAVTDSFNTSGFGVAENPMPLVAIYTSNVDKLIQHQSLAYSLDGKTFSRYSGNPVLDIHSQEFRDPKVFWHYPTHKWVMIISKPDEKKVRFYSSLNLKDWQYMSEFGGIGNIARVWECPDLFELPVENAPERKWVITNSAGHPENGFLAMQYFIGDFDGTKFTASADNYPQYLDNGKDYYAGIVYNNLPSNDHRKIMIGWANCWEYANDIPTTGFRGMMAIPRELKLKKEGKQYMLIQLPVEETNKYRGEYLFHQNKFLLTDTINTAGNLKGDALDIEFAMTREGAAQSGVKVFKNGTEETLIYYNKTDHTIKLDRTRSGNIGFSNRFPSVESASVQNEKSPIKIRILIDKSLVEVFINDGEKTITDQVFPVNSNGRVEFFSNNGRTEFTNVVIYRMNKSIK